MGTTTSQGAPRVRRGDDIAIVGIGCHFPDAPDTDAYRRNIRRGHQSFATIPADRWDQRTFFDEHSRAPDSSYVTHGAFIRAPGAFEPLDFGMAPRRVESTDPQHRLLLQTVRAALRDAGVDQSRLASLRSSGDAGGWRRVATIIGISSSEYRDIVGLRPMARQIAAGAFGRRPSEQTKEAVCAAVENIAPVSAYSISGMLLNMSAANVARHWGFRGPAYALDAACASSLTSVVEGVHQLRSGRCTAVIAGGVYLNLNPLNLIGFSRIGAVSRKGDCRPFDRAADGFLQGEGCGVVVLKTLEQAVADGDRIRAIIRGVGTSNDGAASTGVMAPDEAGQGEALQRAYRDAGIAPWHIGYIEGHGTATPVGDGVEVRALGALLALRGERGSDTWLGSVKANIGHTMSAAGVAGLIKAVLVLEDGLIPPQPSFESPHPDLPLAEAGLRIATEARQWPSKVMRAAGVSSFGFGGTNCHVVIEATVQAGGGASHHGPIVSEHHEPQLVVLSAPSVESLSAYAATLRAAIEDGMAKRASLAEIAFTLCTTRIDGPVRFTAVVDTVADFLGLLRDLERGQFAGFTASSKRAFLSTEVAEAASKVVFMFPGQGGEGGEQAASLCAAFDWLEPEVGGFVGQVPRRRGSSEQRPTGVDDLEQMSRADSEPHLLQPALVAASLVHESFARGLGLEPNLVIGHSLGELAAVACAGAMSREDAVRLAACRGELMGQIPSANRGTMAALSADETVVAAALEGVSDVWVAGVNHPSQTVIAGTTHGVDRAVHLCSEQGIPAIRLSVSHAFHSPILEPACEEIAALFDRCPLRPVTTPVISTVTADVYPESEAAMRQILRRHATAPVRFLDGLDTALELGARIFVEVGPDETLSRLVRRRAPKDAVIVSLGRRSESGTRATLEAIARLVGAGTRPNLRRLFDEKAVRPVSLPTPPRAMDEFWVVGTRRAPLRRVGPSAESKVAEPTVAEPEADQSPQELHSSKASSAVQEVLSPTDQSGEGPNLDARRIVWDAVALVSGFSPSELSSEQQLTEDLGLDSLMIAELTAEIEPHLPGFTERLAGFAADQTLRIGDVTAAAEGRTRDDVLSSVVTPYSESEAAQQESDPVHSQIAEFEEVRALEARLEQARQQFEKLPFFRVHDGTATSTSSIEGDSLINYASYNYLGLSGHPRVNEAAKRAIECHGTSVSASRVVSGERPIYARLERRLAELIGTESALVFSSGHATNETVLGHMVDGRDLIVYDELAHNSIVQGCRLSGASRSAFRHNDYHHLDELLARRRGGFRRCLVAIEGVYSMDGDIPNVPRIIEICRRHNSLLFIDEAHSIGVLGHSGAGIREHFDLAPEEVDIWMGTLSKSFASCGGYIAGSASLVRYLKYTAPGFVFSAGMTPANAAAAHEALVLLGEDTSLVERLHTNADLFRRRAEAHGIDTGRSHDSPIIPFVVGDSRRCVELSMRLERHGIHVQPIVYPAVPEGAARLRFFMSALHTVAQIEHTLDALREEGLDMGLL